jgi:thiol-disulfide isomerase/thioredoxin
VADLVESGRNWSGNERNVAFLNTRDGKFAGVSALLGFDSPADGRGMVLVDWDGDGDQDIWMTQRTAPRLRFLRNDNHSKGNSIQIRLSTDKGNRHAIGARVELTEESGNKQIRTLHAGEGYLSQFSQNLHFGLGNATGAKSLKIQWPDGRVEALDHGLKQGHWLIQKGISKLQPIIRPPSQLAIQHSDTPNRSDEDLKRLIPHSPLKLPSIPYIEANGEQKKVSLKGKHHLLVFWATWCGPCIQELNILNTQKERLSESGLEILVLNVDDLNQSADLRTKKIQRVFRRQSWDLDSAMATKETLEIVDAAREVILGRQWTWSIPCSVLLDENGAMIAFYEGSPSLDQLNADTRNLFKSGLDRQHATPFPGQWYLANYPADRMAMGEVLFEKSMFHALDEYMGSLKSIEFSNRGKAAYICRKAGMESAKANIPLGIQLLGHAIHFEPQDTENLYARAILFQTSKAYAEAINGYESILDLEPRHTRAMAGLAWLLSVSPDQNLRNPPKAIQLAKSACQQTQNKAPEPWDVLAAAYAANGQFSLATQAAEIAISLLPSSQKQHSPIHARIKLFKKNQAFYLNQ